MTQHEPGGPAAGGEPISEDGHSDITIFGQIRDLYQAVDPMPPDLPERIRFALALRDLEFDVAEASVEEDSRLVAARGAEESRTITFDCDSLTIMIRIDTDEAGTARLDGWLAPAQPRTVELVTAVDRLATTADDGGRFVFTQVPRGRVQLLVRAEPGRPGAERAVVAPPLIL